MATLMITISDEALARLQVRAAELGIPLETLASQDLESLEFPPGDDFLKWAGAFDSGLTDVGERHDYYLGQALAEEMRGGRVDDPIR